MYNCLKKKRKVYVVCPAFIKSGGPELLHQLVYELKHNEVDAHMVYFNVGDGLKIHPSFQKYINEFITMRDIEDKENNIVIFPETYVNLINHIKNAHCILWWLSVDNYLKKFDFSYIMGKKSPGKIMRYFLYRRQYQIKNIKNRIDLNLAQSYYAVVFLQKNGFSRIKYLSDYLNSEYLEMSPDEYEKENIVLYNPLKGFEFTKLLIERASEIHWVPLINLSNEEIEKLLCKSKVYIDFGNHPGKDRLPREAAVCGCCVITGKDGSAQFKEDVSIDDQFKFEASEDNIDLIIQKIYDCINNYETNNKCFEEYRKKIKQEPDQFRKDVKEIFLQ